MGLRICPPTKQSCSKMVRMHGSQVVRCGVWRLVVQAARAVGAWRCANRAPTPCTHASDARTLRTMSLRMWSSVVVRRYDIIRSTITCSAGTQRAVPDSVEQARQRLF